MKLPIDKQAHFLAGYAIAITAAIASGIPLIGFALAIIAGIGKEVWDRASGKGTPDEWDTVATILGGIAAEVFYYFIG